MVGPSDRDEQLARAMSFRSVMSHRSSASQQGSKAGSPKTSIASPVGASPTLSRESQRPSAKAQSTKASELQRPEESEWEIELGIVRERGSADGAIPPDRLSNERTSRQSCREGRSSVGDVERYNTEATAEWRSPLLLEPAAELSAKDAGRMASTAPDGIRMAVELTEFSRDSDAVEVAASYVDTGSPRGSEGTVAVEVLGESSVDAEGAARAIQAGWRTRPVTEQQSPKPRSSEISSPNARISQQWRKSTCYGADL